MGTGREAGPAVRVQTEEVSPGPKVGRGENVKGSAWT